MIANTPVDGRIVGDAGVKDPILCGHVQGIYRRRRGRVLAGVGVGLLLDIADTHLDRLHHPIKTRAQLGKITKRLRRQLAEPLRILDFKAHDAAPLTRIRDLRSQRISR